MSSSGFLVSSSVAFAFFSSPLSTTFRYRYVLLSHHFEYIQRLLQAHIPAALCAIHNFIRIHDGDEGPVGGEDYDELDEHGVGGAGSDVDGNLPEDALQMARNFCDELSQHMWNDYQQILQDGGYLDDDDTSLGHAEEGSVDAGLDLD